MDAGARRELEILSSIAEGRPVSQRALAQRLGIALGLTNPCLKRLAGKGHLKATTIPPNRLTYLVTLSTATSLTGVGRIAIPQTGPGPRGRAGTPRLARRAAAGRA